MEGVSGVSPPMVCPQGGASELTSRFVQRRDTDGDGALNAAEFGGPEQLFGKIDSDSSGEVTQDELLAFLPDMTINDLVGAMIHAKDADGNGTLSNGEMGVSKDIFGKIDKNGDGQADQTELVDFLQNAHRGASHARPAKDKEQDEDELFGDDESEETEEIVSAIDIDQDGQADGEQILTYYPKSNIYEVTSTALSSSGDAKGNSLYI